MFVNWDPIGLHWFELFRLIRAFFTRIQRCWVYLDVFNRFSFMNFVETSSLDLT